MPRGIECAGSDLCEELAGAQDTTFSMVYEGEPPSRVITATENFRLLADLSPMTLGHLLLLPVDHYVSFAQLVKDFGDELRAFMGTLEPAYRETFGAFTVLEHGSCPGMESSACISHAHWHILPVDGRRMNELIAADGLASTALTGLDDLAGFDDAPYFLCLHEEGARVYRPRRGMPRQYLRSRVARTVGIADPLWDYALVVRKDLFRETVALTSSWRVGPDSHST
ncbi:MULTISPECIES: HIT domain-containing protein [unclassified Streptomyces]|uniref:HIT family protein n=1 Tax=unclassified Streptomyces TaxID=2593676 RepID=UPI0033CE7BF1